MCIMDAYDEMGGNDKCQILIQYMIAEKPIL
jgi:hypothetical protein